MPRVLKNRALIEADAGRLIFLIILTALYFPIRAQQFSGEKSSDVLLKHCKSDTSVSYSLFVPLGYSPEKNYPLIICFDSHGSGELPVRLMKTAAAKYGYVVAGSNNSKNGQNTDAGIRFYKMMVKDIKSN